MQFYPSIIINTMHSEELLTIPEVATILKVHEITVRRMLKTHALTAYRVGRMYRFRRDDIEAYLRSTRENSVNATAGATKETAVSQTMAQTLAQFIPKLTKGRSPKNAAPRDLSSNKEYLQGLGEK